MNTVPASDRPTAIAAARLPHQRPGAERGLSRGAEAPLDGVDPSFLGALAALPGIISAGAPLAKKIFDLF